MKHKGRTYPPKEFCLLNLPKKCQGWTCCKRPLAFKQRSERNLSRRNPHLAAKKVAKSHNDPSPQIQNPEKPTKENTKFDIPVQPTNSKLKNPEHKKRSQISEFSNDRSPKIQKPANPTNENTQFDIPIQIKRNQHSKSKDPEKPINQTKNNARF